MLTSLTILICLLVTEMGSQQTPYVNPDLTETHNVSLNLLIVFPLLMIVSSARPALSPVILDVTFFTFHVVKPFLTKY